MPYLIHPCVRPCVHASVRLYTSVICGETAEPIELIFDIGLVDIVTLVLPYLVLGGHPNRLNIGEFF